jgi:dTDP-4-amino-4,6-dideoxygalactose transaminase
MSRVKRWREKKMCKVRAEAVEDGRRQSRDDKSVPVTEDGRTSMEVPLLDLKAQYAQIKDELLAAVTEVIESQQCIGGPRIAELEREIAGISDCKYAVGVSSGTDAILNCLMSLDIGPGDEVITTPFTFFSTAGCIARVGAKPVFVDIEPKTFNINPELIEPAVTEKTKAIIPVHLFGQMADMDPIMEIAKKYDLAVIEDAAQSVTSTYKGRKAGSIGTSGCLSFYPSKNLGGIGDGGMIVTNDERLYERLVMMRNHGQDSQYSYKYVGGNFRLDAVQAAALLVKLPHLDAWSQARRENAAYYDKKFAGTAVQTPFVRPDCVSIYNQYCIRVPRRDEVVAHLKENGIGCAIYYPVPLHLQECLRQLGHKEGDFPESERAAKEVLALPIYPEITDQMKDYVAEIIWGS